MSVGIVVMCESSKNIVSVSDEKATFGDFSADHAALKARRIYRDWWTVYAGNDVEYAHHIMSGTADALGDDKATPIKTAAQIVATMNEQYWKVLHAQIENRVLRKHKFTVDTFRETGSKKCTATVYNNLCAKIDKVEISLQFLLYGFDERGRGHIFLVDGREEPKCYDAVGVWAIGSGAHAALSSLAFHIERKELNRYSSEIEEAVYFACEAKFMAESSGQVGKDSTIATIHQYGEQAIVLSSQLAEIKETWKAQGAPRIPADIKGQIATLMQATSERAKNWSTSETSAPEQ